MSPGIRNILAFNSGVEEVLRMKQAEPSLPRGGTIDPAASVSQAPSLNSILFTPSLHEELDRFFRPDVSTASILVPSRYRTLLSQSRQALDRLAASSSDPILQQAARFLSDLESQHRDLDSRRSAMSRG